MTTCRATLRLDVSACSCQSAAVPRFRALAVKKGAVEYHLRGSFVTVQLKLAAVDVVVAHASAKSYASKAAK